MNWDAIGAIGQMLGSLAVFVTLGYLAVQVRDTRQEMQRSISLGRSEVLREMAMTLATDVRLNGLNVQADSAMGRQPGRFRSALMERASLTLADSASLSWEQMAWWQYRAQIIADIGSLRPGERKDFDQATRKIYGTQPIPSFWYQVQKGELDPEAAKPNPFDTVLMESARLTLEESSALSLDLRALWTCYAEAIPYVDQFRSAERTAFDFGVRNIYSTPLGVLWYDNDKPILDTDAVRYIDNLLAQRA